MEGYCSTGQSPQWAVMPMEEEDELLWNRRNICLYIDLRVVKTYLLHVLRQSIDVVVLSCSLTDIIN